MSRPRNHNKGLPKRVYIRRKQYCFFPADPTLDPRDGKMKSWIILCNVSDGEPAMHAALALVLGDSDDDGEVGTMPALCREYKLNKLKRYSPEVRGQYGAYLDFIAQDFKDFGVAQVRTRDCAQFLRNHFKDKHNTAKKYARLMKKLFRYAIAEHGTRDDNPMDQLDLDDYETHRREVLPTHAQIHAIRQAGMIGADGRRTYSGPMFACIVDMAYLCWQRGIDMRKLREDEIHEDYIRFTPSKTRDTSGIVLDIYITPAISAVIERARAIKRERRMTSDYLFPTRKGTPYSKTGLESMWDRARERAKIADGIVFRDLRALGATDAHKVGRDLKDIQTRLAHTTEKTTRIYLKEVTPTRSELSVSLPWEVE
ncbi:tyrosine-type recombinase/integrase [Rugamonas apoptosis]|uniref:Tyrosine-type recombinase/integrase n=1 Tax=Rugamonas apoptosis TaxID=2758570 RepID=A0A7W2F6T0_9BURK|nr:tyrosine-type recombinase/integrase [Rugamonas apoptosis]MBA5686171.1 tyrosine-type recombinase/integrase [Rugamonas apoptosis]